MEVIRGEYMVDWVHSSLRGEGSRVWGPMLILEDCVGEYIGNPETREVQDELADMITTEINAYLSQSKNLEHAWEYMHTDQTKLDYHRRVSRFSKRRYTRESREFDWNSPQLTSHGLGIVDGIMSENIFDDESDENFEMKSRCLIEVVGDEIHFEVLLPKWSRESVQFTMDMTPELWGRNRSGIIGKATLDKIFKRYQRDIEEELISLVDNV
jgi:hypothetical protein